MKRTFFLSLVILSLCGFVSAQSSLAEFDKVRQIRLLHDNRENVRRILADFKIKYSDESSYDTFFNENLEIEIKYALEIVLKTMNFGKLRSKLLLQ